MYASALPYAGRIGADGPLILCNGARIQDPASGEYLFSARLPKHQALRGLRLARAQGLRVNLYLGEEVYVERVSETSRESARKDGVEQVVVGDLTRFLDGQPADPVKILLEMIQVAGLGVAMGNAHGDLKRAARVLAPSHNADGVAEVLWEHVLARGRRSGE